MVGSFMPFCTQYRCWSMCNRPTYLKFSQPLAFEQQVHLARIRAAIGDASDGAEITNMYVTNAHRFNPAYQYTTAPT